MKTTQRKSARERAEKASISMPRLLFDLAKARQVQLGIPTFSDYIQHQVRRDVLPAVT